jgi:preprotein translocase subunit SecG
MQSIFSVTLILVAIIIIVVLLLQARGSGSNLFGEAETTFRSRRGIEQFLFRLTIVLACVFVVAAILNVRFSG